MDNTIKMQKQNGTPVVSSREVAEDFGKEHKNVLQTIESLKAENSALRKMFFESTYKTEGNNRTYPEYLITRDGFSLIVMGFTGTKALEWKLKYIEAFNSMEKSLTEYKPKMTSLGEVASCIKITARNMEKQGSSPFEVMQMEDNINSQFGINLPKLAKASPWEQMTFVVTAIAGKG